ncbi:MAG: GNAT family N-acetyltransferase [Granulosicoccus sp.]
MNECTTLPRICGRTILRRLTDTDLMRFQAYRQDPEVARFQGWDQMTDQEALSFIQGARYSKLMTPGSWSQIGIAERSSGKLIGDVGIFINSGEDEAEIGFSLHRHYQRQGLAREAVREAINLIFERTTVDRIIGITDDRNLASIKLLKAMGMKKMTSLDTIFRGEACTELTFSVLRNS